MDGQSRWAFQNLQPTTGVAPGVINYVSPKPEGCQGGFLAFPWPACPPKKALSAPGTKSPPPALPPSSLVKTVLLSLYVKEPTHKSVMKPPPAFKPPPAQPAPPAQVQAVKAQAPIPKKPPPPLPVDGTETGPIGPLPANMAGHYAYQRKNSFKAAPPNSVVMSLNFVKAFQAPPVPPKPPQQNPPMPPPAQFPPPVKPPPPGHGVNV